MPQQQGLPSEGSQPGGSQPGGSQPGGSPTGPFEPGDAGFGDLGAYDVWGGDASSPRGSAGDGSPSASGERGMSSEREKIDAADESGTGAGVSPTTAALVAAVLLAVIAGSLWATSRRDADASPGPVVAVVAPDTEPYATPDFPVAIRQQPPAGPSLPPPPAEVPAASPGSGVDDGARPVTSPTPDDAVPTPSATTPSAMSPSATTAATTTADPAAQAGTDLARQHELDRAATVFDGRWVAELASRATGAATSPADPDTPAAILAEHRALRDRFGDPVRLLTEADLSGDGQATRWVTVFAPATFASHDAAAAWCGHQAAAESRCVPRRLPTTS